MSRVFRRFQGALEVIILIGGVVILAAASYFLLKGFLGKSGDSTGGTLAQSTAVSKKDVLNLGISPISLSGIQWYSAASLFKTSFSLSNTGSSPASTNVSLKKNSFSDNGVDTSQFEAGAISPASGTYLVLDTSASNLTDFVFQTPEIPVGETIEVVLHYNNSTPYTPVTSFDYSISNPSVELVSSSVESEEKTDFAPPVFEMLVVNTPSAGVGQIISISVPIIETSQISEAGFNLTVEHSGGNFSTNFFAADGLYNIVTGLPGGTLYVRGSVSAGNLVLEFTAPVEGEYWFSFIAVDEWGNTGTSLASVVVLGGGSSPGGYPSVSSIIVTPADPEENQVVVFNVTATDDDGIAWCNITVSDGGTLVDNQAMTKNLDEYSFVRGPGFPIDSFLAQVICSDTLGKTTTVSKSFTVNPPGPITQVWPMFRFDAQNTGAPDYGSEALISSASWPQVTNHEIDSGPAVADLDGNESNGLEVVIGSLDFKVYAFHADGTAVTGWPKNLGNSVYSSPAVVDLDGNSSNGLEVVVGCRDHNVYAFHADGTSVSGWPQSTGDEVYACPAVADLDGNSSNGLEVVIGSRDNNMHAWHADGTLVSGWPKAGGAQFWSNPVIVDLDGAGGLEVVAGCDDSNVYAWHADGTLVTGWPKVTGGPVSSSPAVADLDNNPSNGLEVVIGSRNDDLVYAWHADGTNLAGWPQAVGNDVQSTPAIADLDGVGGLEVVVGCDDRNLYAWHADGTSVSGWPVNTGAFLQPAPGIADLDNNPSNGLEVVIGSQSTNVFAFHSDGTSVSGWPVSTGDFVMSSPAMVDLDGDLGNGLEVVIGSWDHNVYVWHADGTVFT